MAAGGASVVGGVHWPNVLQSIVFSFCQSGSSWAATPTARAVNDHAPRMMRRGERLLCVV